MDIRQLSSQYAVSPQIDVSDVTAIAAAGFGTIICNRPDNEVPPSHQAQAVAEAAKAAGLRFVVIAVTHQSLNDTMVDDQRAAIDASPLPTLAYCASGTRSTIVWALGQAADQPDDTLIQAAQDAGYDIRGLQPELARRFNR